MSFALEHIRKDKRIKNRPGNVARLPCRVRDHIARAARVDLILVGQVQDAVILDERNRLSSVMLEYFVRVCFFHEGHLKSSSCLPRAKSQPGPLHEGVTGPRPLLSTIAFRLKATRISTPPPYSMNHTFVSWVEMSGSRQLPSEESGTGRPAPCHCPTARIRHATAQSCTGN